MSAPLVINLRDGSVWERRGVTPEGVALYALAGSCKCPEYLMATEAELAAMGIAGSADVLPVPVGPEPQRDVEDELTGANLSLWEEEQDNARLRLAWKSARVWRRELRGSYKFAEGSRQRWRTACIEAERERDQLKARVAELELERHVTNEALDDAVRELREREAAVAAEFALDPLTLKARAGASADKLTALLAPTQALREDDEETAVRRSVDGQFPRVAEFLRETGGGS